MSNAEMVVLAEFIRFLEDNGLISFDIKGTGERQFSNRFRIQKYLYLAKGFGLDVQYKYDMYLYGPYSKALTVDYYGLADDLDRYVQAAGVLDTKFDKGRFLNAVRGKNNRWLEIATTLISQNRTKNRNRMGLIDRVDCIKRSSKNYISRVLLDLESKRMIKLSL